MIRGNDMLRFTSKTKRVGDCIEWIGARDKDGYGKFSVGPKGRQRHVRAHRWIFEQKHGKLARGVIVRHRCDNEACVKLAHLRGGTQLQNVHDSLARGNRPRVLSVRIVRQLRRVRLRGGSVRAAALRMGVGYWAAHQAATMRTWKHVT